MATRALFLKELEKLNNDVIYMGTLLEESIGNMIQALEKTDVNLSRVVIVKDDEIDKMEKQIERDAISMIARQQPVASDLRQVTSILKIVTEIERMGDHCQDISEYVIRLAEKKRIDLPTELLDMIRAMKKMAVGVITCFVKKDVVTAREIIDMDDKVDDYFRSIRAELSQRMQKNPEIVPQCIDYLMIIKYLERMGDHSENIAEWIDYIITGELA